MATATGTIVKVWKDASTAYGAVSVAESSGTVEYIGSTPLVDSAGATKSGAQLKTDLTAAVSAIRQAQLAATSPVAISGTVNV